MGDAGPCLLPLSGVSNIAFALLTLFDSGD